MWSLAWLLPAVYLALVVQIAAAAHWPASAALPDLVALATLIWHVRTRRTWGLLVVGAGGLLVDLASPGRLGGACAAALLAGWFVSVIQLRWRGRGPLVDSLSIAAGTFVWHAGLEGAAWLNSAAWLSSTVWPSSTAWSGGGAWLSSTASVGGLALVGDCVLVGGMTGSLAFPLLVVWGWLRAPLVARQAGAG